MSPTHIDIGTTGRCNLNCPFCSRDHVMENGGEEDVGYEEIQRLVDNAVEVGVKYFLFAGLGENLLNKDIFPALQYALDKDSFEEVAVYTNGLSLDYDVTERLLALKNRGGTRFSIVASITGYSYEVYNLFQGSLSKTSAIRDKVYDNMLNFINRKNEIGSNIAVTLKYLICGESKEDFLEFCKFWEGKADGLLYTILENFNEKYSYNSLNERKLYKENLKSCPLMDSTITVLPNQNVLICCCDLYMTPNTVIGNLRDASLKEIMEGPVYQDYVDANAKLDLKRLPKNCLKCRNIYPNLYYRPGDYYVLNGFLQKFDLIKKLKKSKLAFYGCSMLLNYFCMTVDLLDDCANDYDYIIIDGYKSGYFGDRKILQPSKELLEDRKIIVFAEKEFSAIKDSLKALGLDCIHYTEIFNS